MPDNALATYAPSANTSLATALNGLEGQLRHAAEQNIRAMAGDGFTQAELRAMTAIEELKLVNGLDLAAVLMRGKLIRQIEEEALWTIHPEQYQTFDAMARGQGISPSELSNVRDLCFTIFPYFENVLNVSVAQVWENIGKSNMRELVPVLKGIITGEPSNSASVNRSVDLILDEMVTNARTAGQTVDMENTDDARRMRQEAVEHLLEVGQLTNTEVRRRIRPERTASIEPTIIPRGDRRLIVMEVDDDQYTLINRRLQGYMDPVTFELPNDPVQRQREAARIPAVRQIINLIS